jgi:hypothetical protein
MSSFTAVTVLYSTYHSIDAARLMAIMFRYVHSILAGVKPAVTLTTVTSSYAF